MKAPLTAAGLAVLLAACAAGPATTAPVLEPFETDPPQAPGSAAAAGTLPDSGVMARVVNLYADAAGPHDLDAYGFGGNEIVSEPVQVATVPYGTASDWFDPGFVEGSSGGRTLSVAVHLAGSPDQLIGMSDTSAAPGARITVIVPPPDSLGTTIRGTFDAHPDTSRGDVPQAIADKAVLVTSHEGLPDADFESAVFHASVGESCLPGRFRDEQIEEILGRPAPQPIGNDLVVDPGAYTLTVHRDQGEPGEIAACDGPPDAEASLDVAAGGRSYVFLHAAPGDPTVKVLVLPLGE